MADLSLLSVAKDSLGVSPPVSVVKDVLGFVHSPPASLKHRLQMKGRMKRARQISLRSYFDIGNPASISIREEIRQYAIWQHPDLGLGGQDLPDFGSQDTPAPVINLGSEDQISIREVLNLNLSPKVLSLKSFFHIPVYYTPALISIREKIRAISNNSTISLQDTLNKNPGLKVLSLRTYFHIPGYHPPDPVSILDKIRQHSSAEGKGEVSLRERLRMNPIPQASSLRSFFHIPEYRAPDHINVREKINQHLSVFSKTIDSKGTISLQKVLNKNFYILVFGDSIAWGQGLNTKDKFSHIVKNRIATEYPNNDVFIKVLAQSGAPIKPNGTHNSGRRELPSDLPAILQQIENFTGMRKAIDLIMLDGGINDVGADRMVNTYDEDEATLSEDIEKACHKSMKELLDSVTSSYLNSLIITTGYYPVVSNEININDWAYITVIYGLIDQARWSAARFSEQFADESTNKIKLAIRETNSTLDFKRIYFANPVFESKNGAMMSDPWLWGITNNLVDTDIDADLDFSWENGLDIDIDADWDWNLDYVGFIPEDPKRGYRAKHCDSLKCTFASVFHPNPKGAKKYAQAIEKVLKRAGLLTTKATAHTTSQADILNFDLDAESIQLALNGREDGSLELEFPSNWSVFPSTVTAAPQTSEEAPPNHSIESEEILLFVVNAHKNHMEIHRRDCVFAGRIRAENKRLINGDPKDVVTLYLNGVLPLGIIDSLVEEGFNGCYYCLKQYHTK